MARRRWCGPVRGPVGIPDMATEPMPSAEPSSGEPPAGESPEDAVREGTSKESKTARYEFMVRALRYRNYRLFFGGQVVSLVGNWMTQIAMVWLVYRLTNSPLMLGVVSFAGQMPAFLLGPVAGVLIDRRPRHRMLVTTQALAMVQSFALAILALTGAIQVWHIIILIALQGLINSFDMPARQAFVYEIIENKEDLSNAIALNSSMFNLARLIGPSVGGLLIAAVGEGWCFMVDAISYVAVIAALLMMRVPEQVTERKMKSPVQEMREGFAYVVRSVPIRSLLMLMGWMSLVGMPYGVLMPVVASKTLHGGAHTLGFLMAASGVGALCGAIAMAARRTIVGLGKMIPLCVGAFAIAVFAFGQSRWELLSMALLFVMGFAMMYQNASSNTILQTIVDDDKRGRVMSFYTMSFMGMAPFGSLWAGALAERVGAPNCLMVCGIACMVAAVWSARKMPNLRTIVHPIYARLGILPEIATSIETVAEINLPPEKAA